MQTVVAMLAYADGVAAMDRLRAAFGFEEVSPADQDGIGIRHYRAEDLEGHRWMFAPEIEQGDHGK